MSCTHQRLVLLKPPGQKLRCRYCHLTIDKAELTKDFCPECYDGDGVRRRDFELIELGLIIRSYIVVKNAGLELKSKQPQRAVWPH